MGGVKGKAIAEKCNLLLMNGEARCLEYLKVLVTEGGAQ